MEISTSKGTVTSCNLSPCPFNYNEGKQLIGEKEIRGYCKTNHQITQNDSKILIKGLVRLTNELDKNIQKKRDFFKGMGLQD